MKLGFSLLMMSGASGAPVTLIGVTFPSQVIKGIGIIACIFSSIVFLAAYGGIQSPENTGRRR
jgi:hypothetical protein